MNTPSHTWKMPQLLPNLKIIRGPFFYFLLDHLSILSPCQIEEVWESSIHEINGLDQQTWSHIYRIGAAISKLCPLWCKTLICSLAMPRYSVRMYKIISFILAHVDIRGLGIHRIVSVESSLSQCTLTY